MLNLLVFLVVLSVLVLVHELGHFLAAKKAGIKVEEFGFGYPPRIWAKKVGETVYSVNAIPFGGFVRLCGEELQESEGLAGLPSDRRAFWQKSKKARTGVVVAGVLSNFLLGIVCFSLVYSVLGIPTKTDRVKIVGIATDSPAEKMGLKAEDIILSADEETIADLENFIKIIEEKKGHEVKLVVQREKDNPCLPASRPALEKVLGGGAGFSCQNGNLVLWLTPRENPPEGEGALGVMVSDVELVKPPLWQRPFRGAVEGVKEALGWGAMILAALGKMFFDLAKRGVVPKDVAGPIGIFQATAGAAQQGLLSVFQFVGILSVNLAVINILPFPAMDGGKLCFVLYEALTRRRPKPSVEHWANIFGLAFLILLMVLVTINDINRLLETTSFLSRLQPLWPF